MTSIKELRATIQCAADGISISEMLNQNPNIPRRTAQRWVAQLIEDGQLVAKGNGRARRYYSSNNHPSNNHPSNNHPSNSYSHNKCANDNDSNSNFAPNGYLWRNSLSYNTENSHSRYTVREETPDYQHVPLSPDSKDILTYIEQPLEARKPVGYQREFLESYLPNKTWYLPEPTRRQLRKMGDTQQKTRPAGTFGREIFNRLLIDLSWASSYLEGNTYSHLDTQQLIQHGKTAKRKCRSPDN